MFLKYVQEIINIYFNHLKRDIYNNNNYHNHKKIRRFESIMILKIQNLTLKTRNSANMTMRI